MQQVVQNAGQLDQDITKRKARLRCDYTFKSLENNVSDYIDKAGNIVHIRRFFHRSINYIKAYSKYSDDREVPQEVKNFILVPPKRKIRGLFIN